MVTNQRALYLFTMDFTKPRNLFLFTLLLIIFTITYIALDDRWGNFGMNKTVGSAWDFNFTSITTVLSVLVLFISFFSYGIMWFFDLKLNKTFALFNLAFLIPSVGMMSAGVQFGYSLFALLMLAINIANAIWAKKYDKKQNLQ